MIRGLGYVGIGAPDPAACLDFATRVIGLMPARVCPGEDWGVPVTGAPATRGTGIAADGSAYLKLDDRQWRIAVHPRAGQPGLQYLGLEVGGAPELDAVVARLLDAGSAAEHASAADAAARGVAALARTRDPMGNRIELFHSPVEDRKFLSPHGLRFVTGALGLGHLNLLAAPLAQARDFYTRVLGFRSTDFIRFGGGNSANFFHCNARHHTIGLLKVGDLAGVHHLMLEVEDIDMVGQCLERVERERLPVTSTLGRHANDRMLSFYMMSPFGFELEIGCGAIRVGPDWNPREFVEGDIWGHRGLDPETIERNLSGGGAA
jgi:3,4-dihydroxy-9,10-secoandrosta-1,3,5(10)-triene-9,17-dione 4,5-dioxygenase